MLRARAGHHLCCAVCNSLFHFLVSCSLCEWMPGTPEAVLLRQLVQLEAYSHRGALVHMPHGTPQSMAGIFKTLLPDVGLL